MKWARLNLCEIERTLFSKDSEGLASLLNEEPISDDMLRRMVEGYAHVDRWLSERLDVFEMGKSACLLELNHRVLCGVTSERRAQYSDHIAETERRFYDDGLGGIAAFSDWYNRNKTRPPRLVAGGALVQVISPPQLFIEGNSRTGALLASYCLARAGLPPLVVTDEIAAEYHTLVERCLVHHHTGLTRALSMGFNTNRTAGFLERTADARYLLGDAMSDAKVL